MFWASWSSTPQLIAGGAQARARGSESAVSARIMPGIASVRLAMMWLSERRQHVPEDDPRLARRRDSRAASTKSSSRSDRNRPRTTRARPVQPISERISVIAK